MFYSYNKKSSSLGKASKISSRKLTQQIIQDICSTAPYEKKMIELLKLGNDKKKILDIYSFTRCRE